jgi:hypothetical protein
MDVTASMAIRRCFRLYVALAPTPAATDAALREESLRTLQQLVADEDARADTAAHSAVRVRELLAEAYLSLDRPDDAVAVWQDTLDRHPGAAAFKRIDIAAETSRRSKGSR